jgi:hypothetical protein
MKRQFFRVVLHSTNKISGTNQNAMYSIKASSFIPPLDHKVKYQFCVESFVTDHAEIGSIVGYIPSWTQIDSFSTMTNSENRVVFSTIYNNFQRNVTHDTIGILITNPGIINNSVINVVMTDTSGTQISDMGNYIMTIVLYECDAQ